MYGGAAGHTTLSGIIYHLYNMAGPRVLAKAVGLSLGLKPKPWAGPPL